MNNIHFSSRAVIVEIYDSPFYGCPEVSNKSHSTTATRSGQKGKREESKANERVLMPKNSRNCILHCYSRAMFALLSYSQLIKEVFKD